MEPYGFIISKSPNFIFVGLKSEKYLMALLAKDIIIIIKYSENITRKTSL